MSTPAIRSNRQQENSTAEYIVQEQNWTIIFGI